MQPSPGEPSRHGEHHPVAHDSGDGVPEEVYAAHRRAVEAAADLGLGRSARRMLAAVLLATVDHDRVECETPVAELAVMAKLDLDDASAALAVLEGRGIVVRSGDDGRRIGLPVNRSVVPASTAGVNGVGGTTNEPVTASEPQRHNRLGRFKRLSWGVGDQALSSVTNFALSILVAHAVGRHGFGVFGLAFTTYTFALGATRSLCSEPLSVRHSARGDRTWRSGTASSTGAALALGIPMGAICVLGGALANSVTGDAFVALGICLPGLVLQDAWRTAFFSKGQGIRAFANDLVWAAVQFPAMLIAISAGAASAAPLILCWGGAATVAALFGLFQSRVVPEPHRAQAWFRSHRDIAPRFFIEFLARYGTNAGTIYITAIVGGVTAAGAFRAGQVLLGPINLFNIGLTGVAVYEAVRLRDQPRRMQRMALLLGGGIAAVSLAWGALMLGLPASIGHKLLAQSWEAGHSVLVPLTIAAAASGLLTGATVGLRALAAAKRSLRVRLITAAVTLAASAVGAASYGAVGAATGLAFGLSAGAVLWLLQLNGAVREALDTSPTAGRTEVKATV